MTTPADELAPRLAEGVATYRSRLFFLLRDDLGRLDRARRLDLPEAAVVYGARVLEVLAADALELVGLPPERQAFSDLSTLEQFNLAPLPTLYWAHALRRTGNDVRHVRRPTAEDDAELAALFLERWLRWFFCYFQYRQHRLRAVTLDGWPLWGAGPELRELLDDLDALDEKGRPDAGRLEAALARVREGGPASACYRTAALPSVLAERLIQGGDPRNALEVLQPALDRSDSLRLRQLQGLALSRLKEYEEALQVLEPLRRSNSQDPADGETEGIVAGVYKRQGRLDECQKAYAKAWRGSRKSNVYLGVNAATVALLLGRAAEARRIAADVRQRLEDRLRALAARGDRAEVVLGYWDQVTLAEAILVLGDLEAAGDAYRLGFDRHPERPNDHEVTRDQALRVLSHLDVSAAEAERFRGRLGR
jgi:tetratricopeptide (TPR) repeat protein